MFLLVLVPGIFLSSCAPGQDHTGQVATIVAAWLMQTASPADEPAVSSLSDSPTALERDIEDHYGLGKLEVETVQPVRSAGLKPPDGDMPAAGICGGVQGDPVVVILGLAPDGLPKAGRCIAIHPEQRIRLINQSDAPLDTTFAEFHLELPVGGEVLLDQPAGEYLALGVHIVPMGPELWLKGIQTPPFTMDPPPATTPVPSTNYSNGTAGYSLTLPAGWNVDENGLANPNKEVLFYPGDADPLVTYLSISLDFRTKNQIKDFYAQHVSDAFLENTMINGYPGIKYTYNWGREEYFIPYQDRLFLVVSDRPGDENIQWMLGSLQFIPISFAIEATMADNGRTFIMKVGDQLRLDLDMSYDWSAFSISNPTVIVGGQEGLFALGAGTATLTTVGNPDCLNSTPPCGMPSILYSITVVVQ